MGDLLWLNGQSELQMDVHWGTGTTLFLETFVGQSAIKHLGLHESLESLDKLFVIGWVYDGVLTR